MSNTESFKQRQTSETQNDDNPSMLPVSNNLEYAVITIPPEPYVLNNKELQGVSAEWRNVDPKQHAQKLNGFLDAVKKFRDAWKPKGFRPLPVFIAGREVDLLALLKKVKQLGGYHRITKQGSWTALSTDMGFIPECAPSLKLAYIKYLKRLESGMLLDHKRKIIEPGMDVQSPVQLQHSSSNKLIKSTTKVYADRITVQAMDNNDGALCSDPLFEMLIWVKRLALNPGDPKTGQGPEGSRQNGTWVEECSRLANKVRSSFWKTSEEATINQVRQHAQQNDKIVRLEQQASERVGARAHQTRYLLRRFPAVVWCPLTHKQIGAGDAINVTLHKRIPIGSDFQAILPPWHAHRKKENNTEEEAVEAQKKWLGIKIWSKSDSVHLNQPGLGKGRPLGCKCKCIDRNSIDCVRIHVKEKRERLILELDDAFARLGFDEMGECVSEKWTYEEQRAFKDLVKRHPISSGENFWDHLPKYFPCKPMRDLVSYYFNVFVVQRRAIQNRTDLRKVNSDDDEGELPGTDDDYSGSYDIDDGAERTRGGGISLPYVGLNRSPMSEACGNTFDCGR